LQKDARSLGLKAVLGPISDANSIEAVFSNFARESRYGIVVLQDIFTTAHRGTLTKAAARYRLPAVYSTSAFVAAGGLISYGSNPVDAYRQAASYIDRILKGEKPGDLPVQQPTRFELAVNIKTAKVLGVKIPASILVRADRVIE
jgi:putative ABC transport system substrate-binding protein